MVDPISTSAARPRIVRPGEDAGLPIAGHGCGRERPGHRWHRAGDSVSLSATAQSLPEELKGGPPMDLTIVAKIKEAIAEGKVSDRSGEDHGEPVRELHGTGLLIRSADRDT